MSSKMQLIDFLVQLGSWVCQSLVLSMCGQYASPTVGVRSQLSLRIDNEHVISQNFQLFLEFLNNIKYINLQQI